MRVDYVPLLKVQRELLALPRGRERFEEYLRTIVTADGADLELVPLVAANPMAREHVAALLDELLALGADEVGARAAAEAAGDAADVAGAYRAALVVVDDALGGGTNRYAYEFDARFGPPALRDRPTKRFWITAMLWSSEPADVRAAREAVLTAVHRAAHVLRHGPARTLADMLAQEGRVLAAAGCMGPVLDTDELAYTREVLAPHLGATDVRTAVECLFGDEAARSLGFAPRGLSPWAGIALALHDARDAKRPAVG